MDGGCWLVSYANIYGRLGRGALNVADEFTPAMRREIEERKFGEQAGGTYIPILLREIDRQAKEIEALRDAIDRAIRNIVRRGPR
jgi:hypothetical protein